MEIGIGLVLVVFGAAAVVLSNVSRALVRRHDRRKAAARARSMAAHPAGKGL